MSKAQFEVSSTAQAFTSPPTSQASRCSEPEPRRSSSRDQARTAVGERVGAAVVAERAVRCERLWGNWR